MNFLIIEKLRLELIDSLPYLFGKTKLFRINSFYSSLLSTNDKSIIEAYSLDFIEDYLFELQSFTAFYQSPEKTKSILTQLDQLKSINTLTDFKNRIKDIIEKCNSTLDELENKLEGLSVKSKDSALKFPLLEISPSQELHELFGTVESINIKIHKTKNKNRFIFIPSAKSIEEQLLYQAKISYELAVDYLKRYKRKFNENHEILIYFENLNANYEGNSLGIALTIGFINQLSQLYNLPFITNIKNDVVSTGSLNIDGTVKPIGKDFIEKKVEVVFYSVIDTFIIPAEDEYYALESLKKLNSKYPNRKLHLVAVRDFYSLVNRRDLVDIRKQNRIERLGRGIRNNWFASLMLLILTLILTLFFVREYDDTPAYIMSEGKTMFVKNKGGKVLWTKNLWYITRNDIYKTMPDFFHLLVDIDNDGNNEIIASQEIFPDSLDHLRGRIVCFDTYGKVIWQYIFKDTMRTDFENIDPYYHTSLIGIINEKNKKVLLSIARNGPNFPSAVFKLNIATGDRLPGTLWNPGHIVNGLIRKNENGKIEVVCTMINNDYELSGIFGIDYDKINSQVATPYKRNLYKLVGTDLAELNYYIFVPQTDYSKYYKQRNNLPDIPFKNDKKMDAITFSMLEAYNEEYGSIGYEYKTNLRNINIVIGSTFRVRRDSLVAQGILNPPYTDTPEYKALLKSKILYWNGKEFLRIFK